MSWDARLTKDCGITHCEEELHVFGDWNFTHNTSRMANAVLPDDEFPETWWKHLNGMSGAKGGEFLDRIIRGMETDQVRLRAMNPENGWGDFDSFLGVLHDMHKASLTEQPTVWGACG